jgi:general secretion pathway protein H
LGFVVSDQRKFQNENHRRISGFTLLELLVVLVVVGIMLGMVTMNAMPNKKQILENDVRRVALLLQLAREEAIVRNRPVALEVDSEQFRFYVRENSSWQLLTDNDLLRERHFQQAPLTINMQPSSTQSTLPLKIVFGREPVDKPFMLTFTYDDVSVSIQADGLGHFSVE